MSTTVYFTNVTSPIGFHEKGTVASSSDWFEKFWKLSSSRGDGVVSVSPNCVNGPTLGVVISATHDFQNRPYIWISDPLDQDVTISGSITWNLCALESAMTANVAINGRIFRWLADPGTGLPHLTTVDQTARTTELATSEAAQNFAETPAAGVAFSKGDRICIEIFGDDATSNMSSGNTFTFFYNGTTAGASGDSYVTFTETFGFLTTEPAGSTLYLTDTTGPTVTGSSTKEMWTSRGGGATSKQWYPQQPILGYIIWNSSTGYGTPSAIIDEQSFLGIIASGSQGIDLGDAVGDAEAQSFVPSQDVRAYAVIMPFTDMGGAGSQHNISLRDDNGSNRPGSTVYFSDDTSLQNTQIPYVAAIFLGSGFDETLTSGTKYWWRVYTTVANAANFARVSYVAGGGGTSGGQRIYNNGGAWTETSDDVVMQIRCGKIMEWYSRPLQAFTLSDLIRVNLRLVGESGAVATPSVEIAVTDGDGSNVNVYGHSTLNDTTYGQISTSAETAYQLIVSGDDISVADGQRIRLRIRREAGLNRSSSEAPITDYNQKRITAYYNGTSGGASGDAYITLSQSVSEYGAAAGEDSFPYVGAGYFPS